MTRLSAFCQAWAMHEAEEDAMESDPISLGSIIIGIVFACFIYALYKFSKVLKKTTQEKYKKLVKLFLTAATIIAVSGILLIKGYYEIKFSNKEKEAKEYFNKICNDADVYVKYADVGYASFAEMKTYYFDKKVTINDYPYINEKYDIRGPVIDGVYNCYRLSEFSGPSLQVIFAKEANRGSSIKESPSLYSFTLAPYRIRCFTPDADPEKEIYESFPLFCQRFNNTYLCNEMIDILDYSNDKYTKALNDYFEISPVPGGEYLFSNNDILFDCDYAKSERVYEYDRVNYGKYEIIYGIRRVTKLAIKEQYQRKNIYGYSYFGLISSAERFSAYARFSLIFIIISFLLAIFFLVGKPKPDNKK